MMDKGRRALRAGTNVDKNSYEPSRMVHMWSYRNLVVLKVQSSLKFLRFVIKHTTCHLPSRRHRRLHLLLFDVE